MNVNRIRLLSLLVFAAAALIITRLFYIQIVHGSEYTEDADRQYSVPVGNIFDRGTIYFQERDGNLISAASLKTGYFLVINPAMIENPDSALDSISKVVVIDRDQFLAKASKKKDQYEEILHRIPKESADEINALKIPGVSLYRERWRFYPAGRLAAHTLGFIAYKEDTISGRYGIERSYEKFLKRKNDDLYVNFFAQVFTNLKDSLFSEDAGREGDIITTIDPAIQISLERELSVLHAKYDSEISGGIIIDPMSGKIYALAKLPNFDLNKFQEEDNVSVFNNEIVEGVYEMGSIIKPLTMAAALDAGSISAKTTYFDKGFVELNGRTVYNFDKKGRGTVSMQGVLNESLNTGAIFAMQKLGKERFKDYFYSFGLGEKTDIDLPGESLNLISNLSEGRDIEFASASFGQGIALTPVSTARAMAVLGNGGYLITPHIIERIDYKGGLSEKIDFPKGKQVIKKETSEEITRMLVQVVDKALLGGERKMEHYSVAAKTGTAQLLREDGLGYYEDRFLHTFFGYFPAYEPKFLILLFTKDPKGEKYASHTLTDPFMNLTKFLINYYELPPDR